METRLNLSPRELAPYLRNKVITVDANGSSLLRRLLRRVLSEPMPAGRPLFSERLLEYPLIFQALPEDSRRVMEFGCCDGLLSLHLAAMGYEVTGLDFQAYPFAHPNLRVLRGDILSWEPMHAAFDAVVSVSVVEHVGLGGYGDPVAPEGDRIALTKLYQCVRPGGVLLTTVPAGAPTIRRNMRIYDEARLRAVLPAESTIRWFAKTDRYGAWSEVTARDIEDLRYESYEAVSPAQGLAFVTTPA
jgi:2-polyprenyl-3-methyl-5-hydroxy-6-metoxy-1,4-benzoquinol methylase